jgi:hypothetical protein
MCHIGFDQESSGGNSRVCSELVEETSNTGKGGCFLSKVLVEANASWSGHSKVVTGLTQFFQPVDLPQSSTNIYAFSGWNLPQSSTNIYAFSGWNFPQSSTNIYAISGWNFPQSSTNIYAISGWNFPQSSTDFYIISGWNLMQKIRISTLFQ